MVRKFVCLIFFVILISLVSSASAANIWTNTAADNDWTNPANWSLGVIPGPLDGQNTQISGTAAEYLGGGGPIITAAQVASTGQLDTWGPEFGIGLDIEGGILSGPAFIGLNIEGDEVNPAYLNLGAGDTGGSIDVVNLLVGDSWWWSGGGAGASYNQWSGTSIANDYIWLGGKMNLYGGYTKATNGFSMASVAQPNTQCTLDIWDGAMLSLPTEWGNPLESGIDLVNGWITNGYLTANGGDLAYHIDIDTELEPGRIVLTSVPEPATIALMCLGGLALIRRKRS